MLMEVWWKDNVEISISKMKVLRGILLAILMISASITVIFLKQNLLIMVVGFIGAFVYSFGLIFQISKLFYFGSLVIINSEGIEDVRLGCGIIRWSDIESVSLEKTRYASWLNIGLISPEKYYSKLTKRQIFLRKLNEQPGKNNLRIRFIELERPIGEAFDLIENIIKNGEYDLSLAP